jgi:Family of unknown function (DUF6130)/Cytochrome P460
MEQTAKGIRTQAAVEPLTSEPPPRIIIDPPLAGPLAHGRVVIKYRAENLRIDQVFGPNALDVSPRTGHTTAVQIMVKDSKKYAATGGWGFGRFIDGKAVDEAQHETCFPCHQNVKGHDWIFTRWAL